MVPAYHAGNLVQYRVRKSVQVRAALPLHSFDGFETGLARGAKIKFNDSSALRLRRRAYIVWEQGSPATALVVKKPNSKTSAAMLKKIGDWLIGRGLKVYVERPVQVAEFPEFEVFETGKTDVELCITLGGDGTVLHLASLFGSDNPLPPVISFAMGSLGFLTPFDVNDFSSCLTRVLDANKHALYCTLRTRKRCEVYFDGVLQRVHHVLNECVIDRGAFPNTVMLEFYIDNDYVTTVEADGVIVATPSGSTAYSMSAGGSMVAPSVPCTLVTPLAPHSLSFRPLILPESSSILIHLPEHSRSHARASFDGKHPMRIPKNASILFTTSLCPLPVINMGNLDKDWYEGITQKLKWNQAIRDVSVQLDAESNGRAIDLGHKPGQ